MSADDLPDDQQANHAAELGRLGALYSPNSARAWGETISRYGYDNVLKTVKSLRKIHNKPVSLLYVNRQLAKEYPDVAEPTVPAPEAELSPEPLKVIVPEVSVPKVEPIEWDERAATFALNTRGLIPKLAKLMDVHTYRFYEWKSKGVEPAFRAKFMAALKALPADDSRPASPEIKAVQPLPVRKPKVASNDDLAIATELLEVAVHLRQDGNSHWKAIGRIGSRLVQKALGE